MKRQSLKLLSLIIALILIIGFAVFILTGISSRTTAKIISSNFIGYDLVRAVTGDKDAGSMLLKPGTDTHDFEPTPEDILAIKDADLFVYVGGESDAWLDELLLSKEIPSDKILRLMNFVEVKEEATADAASSDAAPSTEESSTTASDLSASGYDEHIWTSPVNTTKLTRAVKDRLVELYPENADLYNENASAYLSRLSEIDAEIRSIVSSASTRELIFADRFPFRYFADEYGLTYFAAFPGCADESEASSATIAALIDHVRRASAPAILKIELTSDDLARAIADETGAKVLTLHSAHNISSDDFQAGLTYADLMTANLSVLKEALH